MTNPTPRFLVTAAAPRGESANPPHAVLTIVENGHESVRYEYGVWQGRDGAFRAGQATRYVTHGGRTIAEKLSTLPPAVRPTGAEILAAMDAAGL